MNENDQSGSEDLQVIDAIDLHADVASNGVSIHMDGDRDAEMWIEGPTESPAIHDKEVLRITLHGDQSGVRSEIGFFVARETLEEVLENVK